MSPLKQDEGTAKDSMTPDFLRDNGISPIGADELAEMERNATNGAADDIAKENGLYNNEDLDSSENAAPGDDGKSKGAAAESEEGGGFYKGDQQPKGLVGKFLNSKRGKWIAGGVGGGIVGVSMLGIFLLPLKVLHIADNLQSTFFSSTEKSMEDTTNRLLAGYLIRHVMPGMSGTCQSTLNVDKSCAVVGDDDGIVTVLYRSWRDANLEGQLADKYGIEIRRDGGRYMMRIGDQTLFSGASEADIKNERFINDKMFAEMDRKEVRKQFLKAMENETFYKRMMYRYKYGAFMERKYGIVRCLIACEYRNDRADKKELRNIKFKAWLAHRVIGPMNETYSLAFECALGGFNCVSEGSYETSDDGDRRSQFETDVRARVGDAIGDGRMTKERLAKVQGDIEDIRRGGLSNHLFKKVFGPVVTKVLGSAIPGVGLLDAAARLVDGVQSAGPAVKTMNYVMKSQIYVQSYMMYRTNADEIKAGTIDMEELGYVATSLGKDFGTDQGGLHAEASSYYNDIMSDGGNRNAFLPSSTAYAAGYTCDDGSHITTGLCPELAMGAATSAGNAVGSVSDVLNGVPGLEEIADAWLATGGKVFDKIGDLLGSIVGPIFGAITPDFLKERAGDIGKAIADWFSTKFLVNPLNEDPSGARMFDAAAMGANVAANEYTHYGLGAGEISDSAANNLRAERQLEQLEEFQQKSLFAKLFDTTDINSAVSQLALATPSDGNVTQSLARSFMNPTSVLGLLAPANKADAAAIRNLDLGGVTQYGYRESHDFFKVTDYEKYWRENSCDDEEKYKQWSESSTLDEDTGMYVNAEPYPCKLLESAAQANCGYFDDTCIPPEDMGGALPGLNGGGSNFRALAFNILHYPDNNWEARLPRSVRTIKENNTDIAALQEVRPQQLKLLKQNDYLADQYDIWPNATERPGFEPNIVIWKRDKFRVVSQDFITIKYFNNADEKIPIIKFEDIATGQQFYFSSTHDPTGREYVDLRLKNANTYADYFNNLQKRDPVPAIIAGDFNSGFVTRDSGNNTVGNKRENLTYCVLTRDGPFWNSYDAWKNKTGPCPTTSGVSAIDHIYISKTVQVSNYFAVPKGVSTNGSDHPAIFSDIEIPGMGQGAGTEFNIATYNQPSRGDASKAINKIVENKFDVVGMQETYRQYGYLRTNLGRQGYSVYPDWSSNNFAGQCSSSRSIFYKKDKFRLVRSEVISIPREDRYGSCPGGEVSEQGKSNLPIVWLQDIDTGQTIIVMNTHNNAFSRGEQKRYRSAQIYINKIQSLRQQNTGIPIFFTGDFNEGTGVRYSGNTTYQRKHQNLLYCMFKSNNLMVPLHSKGEQPCKGDREGIGGVDFIYGTPGIKVLSKGEFTDPSTNQGPHPVLFARVQVPAADGGNGGANVAGWSWPLKNNVRDGPCYGGSSGHAGMDMNTSTTTEPVLAMHSGRVVRKGYDSAAGNYVTILADAQFNGKPVYYSYEHLKSGSIKVGDKDKVNGGQVIGIAGTTGRVSLGSSKAHLHIVTATTNTLGSYGNLGTTFNPMNILKSKPAPGGYKCYPT